MSNPWTYVDLLLILGVVLGTGGAISAYRSDRRRLYLLGKTVASLSFVALALSAGFPRTSWAACVALALICAALGDMLLSGRAPGFFAAGFVLFVSAHVLFSTGFVLRGAPGFLVAAGAVVATVAAALAWWWLSPHLQGWLRLAVPGYLAIVSVMVATGWATAMTATEWATTLSDSEPGQSVFIGIGVTFVYLSDLAVARERFVAKAFVNKALGLPLYYAGQALIALALARYAIQL